MKKTGVPIILTDRATDSELAPYTSLHSTDCADCACSVSNTPRNSTHSQHIGHIEWIKNEPTYEQKLSEDQTLLFGPFHEAAVLNTAALNLWKEFDNPTNLLEIQINTSYEDAIRQLVDTRLISPSEVEPQSLDEVPETLAIWLHLTDICNLRCHYCYLPHKKQNMSLQTGIAAIDASFRSAILHSFKCITIKYAGGEALIDFPLILELHEYATKLGAKHQIKIKGIVLSNGTIIDKTIAELLVKHELQLMISLDGLGQDHDMQRPYAGGKGSYLDVRRGIEIAHSSEVQFSISITVTTRNAPMIGSLVKWILTLNVPFTLNFYRENTLSEHNSDLLLEDEIIISGMLDAYKEIERNLPRRKILDSIIDRANLSAPHLRTCGVGNNYLVFDCDGSVSKCQMQMKHTVSDIKAVDPLHDVRLDTIGINNAIVDEKLECSVCEWKYWCAGGCSAMTFWTTGRYDVKSPYCDIYKALFPAVMRLEGLRLIKYSGA